MTKKLNTWLQERAETMAEEERQRNRPKPKPPEERVYFVTDGYGIKIGISDNIPSRIKTLQCGNPREIVLLGSFLSTSEYRAERNLHDRFAADRIRGEWFRDTPELRALIAARCPANDNAPQAPARVA